jgi:hypothetical protein
MLTKEDLKRMWEQSGRPAEVAEFFGLPGDEEEKPDKPPKTRWAKLWERLKSF